MTAPAPKLGIIAGGGQAPLQLIEFCRAANRPFFAFPLAGQADKDAFTADIPHLWIPFGAASALRERALVEGIGAFVFLGHVRRPSLAEIKPDWLALKALTRIGLTMLGDDGVLRAIAAEFEREGFRVIGVQDVYRDFLLPQGILTATAPDAQAEADIARGLKVAETLGSADVGQAVVVQEGIVLGVEAVEGTAALLARIGPLQRQGPGGVLVKLRKPSQDPRFDLPTIGPQTFEQAAAAGLRGIAAGANDTLWIERERCLELARRHGLFLVGIAAKATAGKEDQDG